jgi:hypothetical protein
MDHFPPDICNTASPNVYGPSDEGMMITMRLCAALGIVTALLLCAAKPDPRKVIGWNTGCASYRINLYGYGYESSCSGDYTRIYVQFNPPEYHKVFYSKQQLAEAIPRVW